jgi:hypothetical protein
MYRIGYSPRCVLDVAEMRACDPYLTQQRYFQVKQPVGQKPLMATAAQQFKISIQFQF